MIHIEKKKRERGSLGYILSFAALLLGLLFFLACTRSIAGKAGEERLNALAEAVRRASVQCYAIEGRYPPSVEYLEEHYGVSIDRSRYHVFYDGWASNIMPEITILPADQS